ncbi:MAG: TIGR02147 family protein [Bacteriovoracaceae bacterium]|nr:TIGR02147 family protein [Bacteriovoracaceae bacterium]
MPSSKSCTSIIEDTVYGYSDHLEFFQDRKDQLNAMREKVTFLSIAETIGISSRTKMKRIFKGDMKMSKNVLSSLGIFFGLKQKEIDYLELLRVFAENDNIDKAMVVYDKIIKIKKKNSENDVSLNETQLKMLDQWYYAPIYTYLGMSNISCDLIDIASAFHRKLSVEQVREAIEVLITIKVLKYTENGKIVPVNSSINILDGLPRPLVKKFHIMMIEQAKKSVMGMPKEKRFLMSATLSMKQIMVPVLKKKIQEFIVKIYNDFSVEDGNTIYQINSQLFNLADCKKEITSKDDL